MSSIILEDAKDMQKDGRGYVVEFNAIGLNFELQFSIIGLD